MVFSIVIFALGLILLIKGADWLVTGASALAARNNISDLTIGLTIVAFGTSSPELVVNIIASIDNRSDIVFGNVIGSNNFNLFAILGIVGLIKPLQVQSSSVWKEIPISFIAILILYAFANDFFLPEHNVVTRLEGALLIILFGCFLFYVYRQMGTESNIGIKVKVTLSSFKIWVLIVAGLAGLIAGGKLVVNNAIEIASELGVSEKIIGLTIVAAGTSLPELVTSVVAAIKKNNDIAIGNIIGSNIFNILLILSVSALINPIQYNPSFNLELYILALGTFFLFIAMFLGNKHRLDRWQAAFLLITFIVYTIYMVI